ncbi:2-methylthioadenine synthase [Lasius niger]|uniref:2-methylthioadenine synthase n=1 Tax=Lasius niger TaxID=67767 RepID=A0A0J7KHA3_LASNI|nr:2-methylthioadenine synthase [Lasius niger]
MENLASQTAGEEKLLIVNSCAVTAEAERQARQAIRKAHKEDPSLKIVLTGCASERNPEQWKDLPGVSKIVSNIKKLSPKEWGLKETQSYPAPQSRRTRALLQIQQGCDHSCTFCVIPQGRGKARSLSKAEIIAQAGTLIEAGHKEIVITGVDIASWKEDNDRLGKLCRAILEAHPNLPRLRLSSIDPELLAPNTSDPDLWELIEHEERFVPYLHLSLQAGSTLILKRMKRRHSPEDVTYIIERTRKARPNFAIGADLIAGFPTETDELFDETFASLSKWKIPFMHVFPYSERPNTPAAKMPSVPKKIRQERAKDVRLLGQKHCQEFLTQFVGQEVSVLFETEEKGMLPEFARFRLEPETARKGISGEILQVKITRATENELFGHLILNTQKFTEILTGTKIDEDTLEALEDELIAADLGPEIAALAIKRFRAVAPVGEEITTEQLKETLAGVLEETLKPVEAPFILQEDKKPHVLLMVGVNGTGKTTTSGKLAAQFALSGKKVFLAAGDTFRAAAVEQLQTWGDRAKVPVITGKMGGDAASVAYDALDQAIKAEADLLIIDTAGRLHNKNTLMEELAKMIRVIKKLDPEAPHSVLLTLDAVTGQNALDQVRIFRELVQVTGLIITKLDGTARGGIVAALASGDAPLPVHYVGFGEKLEDLRPFEAKLYAKGLVGLEDHSEELSEPEETPALEEKKQAEVDIQVLETKADEAVAEEASNAESDSDKPAEASEQANEPAISKEEKKEPPAKKGFFRSLFK